MKAVVDKDECIGCGLCVETCPEVFDMDGDVADVIVDEIPSDAEDAAQEAADSCPVDCITIEE